MELVVAVASRDTTINKDVMCNDTIKKIITQGISTVTLAVKKLSNLFMTARLLRFKAEAAIPAARPRALSAGYTSEARRIFHSTAAAHLLKSINQKIDITNIEVENIIYLFIYFTNSRHILTKGNYSCGTPCDVGTKESLWTLQF